MAKRIPAKATPISKINTEETLKFFVNNPVTKGITINAKLEAKSSRRQNLFLSCPEKILS